MKRLLFAIISCIAICTSAKAQCPLIVNEIQVANIDQFIDNSNNYGSWIELYNPTDADIDLAYWYISDDETNYKNSRFLSSIGKVPANGYKTIWFDHYSSDGNYGSGAGTQVRFKLDTEGGKLFICNKNLELQLTVEYPAAISRCSYARTVDGGDQWAWSSTPTPGATNNGMTFASTQMESPVISVESGLFTEAFTFNISVPDNATLVYTVNGSTPTLSNGVRTSSRSFKVSGTSVYRFCAFGDGYLPSEVITRSFIFRDKDYTLPIVSVVTNNANLYDDIIGVYTDGTNGIVGNGVSYKSNKNMDWERPVNFDYITADGKSAVNQEATFYVSGGWSRHWSPTSFKLKAEKRYQGKNSFNCQFFPLKPALKNKVLVMRNGGNDTGCRLRDALIQRILLTSGLYIDAQDWNPCHVFLNGKYHALLNMREPNNKFYAYANYGYDTDEVDAFEFTNGGYKQKAGTITAYNRWGSLSSYAENEEYYKELLALVDIDEYINYMAAETFIGSGDWYTNNNNIKGFRSTNDGRFHMMVFDVDDGFSNNDMLVKLKSYSANRPSVIFNNMAKNASFKRQFINAYCLMDGSIFTPERTQSIANEMGNIMAMPLSFDGREPWSTCNFIIDRINSSKSARMNSLRTYFSLGTGSSVAFKANIPEARILLDGQQVPTNTFDGTLFAPFTLSASAPAGYNFVGWQKGATTTKTLLSRGSQWRYYDKGSLDGTDWKTGSVSSWSRSAAPLGYGKSDIKTTVCYGDNANAKYPTYYFRSTVTLFSEPDSSDKFTLDYTADDGFIIYVNGKEAGRHLMPEGEATYSTYATTYCPGNPDTGTLTLDAGLFVRGGNDIAVEVHNNSGTSSDIYWDAAITQKLSSGTVVTTERDITIDTDENCVLTAVFKPVADECLIAAGSTPVVVNEVSAANSIFANDYYKRNDWIELYNTTSTDIDAEGMYISDNPSNPQKYRISGDGEINTVIPAHGYLIIWADKLDPLNQLHANFKLGNDDEASVVLTASDGSWSDRLTYMSHTGEESVGRYPDGGKRIYRMSRPTYEAANTIGTYSEWISGEEVNFDEEAYITGIDRPNATAAQPGEEYFTIDGMRLDAPQRGLNIVRATSSDGIVTTRKVVVQ